MTAALFAFLILVVPSPTAAAPAADFAACESRFSLQPEIEESTKCFYDLSREPGQKDEATRRVGALLARHPGHPWLTLYLGHLDSEHSERLYRAAARAFAARFFSSRSPSFPAGDVARITSRPVWTDRIQRTLVGRADAFP
jgi:hypothetical protein